MKDETLINRSDIRTIFDLFNHRPLFLDILIRSNISHYIIQNRTFTAVCRIHPETQKQEKEVRKREVANNEKESPHIFKIRREFEFCVILKHENLSLSFMCDKINFSFVFL
jgi:hypothetical protein